MKAFTEKLSVGVFFKRNRSDLICSVTREGWIIALEKRLTHLRILLDTKLTFNAERKKMTMRSMGELIHMFYQILRERFLGQRGSQ